MGNRSIVFNLLSKNPGGVKARFYIDLNPKNLIKLSQKIMNLQNLRYLKKATLLTNRAFIDTGEGFLIKKNQR